MKILLRLSVLFLILIPLGYYFVQPKKKQLPIINPIDVNEATVDPELLLRMGYGHKIADFAFLNQEGKMISSKSLKGKSGANTFTTCGSICPKMNEQLQRVQAKFEKSDDVRLLSFTVNPETDTVEQLSRYATEENATSDLELFTGAKEDLYGLARKSFFL